MFEIEGEVQEILPNLMFRVLIKTGPEDMLGKVILCTLAGKMRMFHIQVLLGDKVKADVSKYDTSKGRITFRVK
jgi:translation initiation factor IF-1